MSRKTSDPTIFRHQSESCRAFSSKHIHTLLLYVSHQFLLSPLLSYKPCNSHFWQKSIYFSRKRLSRLLAREKSQRLASSVRHRYSPKPLPKFSTGAHYSPLKASAASNKPHFSYKAAYRSSTRAIRVGGDNDRTARAIDEQPVAGTYSYILMNTSCIRMHLHTYTHTCTHIFIGKVTRFQTINTIISETDRLDANILRNVSEGMSKVCKSVLSSSGYPGLFSVFHDAGSSLLSYFGVTAVQLWVVDKEDDNIFAIRSDGQHVKHPSSIRQKFFDDIQLTNSLDATSVVFPSSAGWTTTQDIGN